MWPSQRLLSISGAGSPLAAAILALMAATAPLPDTAQAASPPHLVRHGTATQLIVDDKPYLILGGELGNSSASNLNYLSALWPKLEAAGLNTALTPVEWDQIEPVEGRFDFTVLDGVVAQARTHHIHLVLLWFGAWKNSMSTYVPAWVKHDDRRFSRAKSANGEAQDILSAFDPHTLAADKAAFVALMAHLKASDSDHTVIMVQVENEIGMLPDARDHSALADKAFNAQKDGDEVFQARAYARFVEAEVKAGKAGYPLPMYVNAALNKAGKLAGQYPSGGPLPHLFNVWKAEAPDIDMLSPDIYWPDFTAWSDRYAVPGNALFIPEGNRAGMPESAANALYAIGQHSALGFSPFAIETLDAHDPLVPAYAMLGELSPLILAHQLSGDMRGLKAPVAGDGTVDETPQSFDLGGYRFTATFIDPWTPKDKQAIGTHGAILIRTGPDEYIAAGSGVTFTLADPEGARVGIEQIVEGHFVQGQFVEGRWLNGDESHQGRHLRLPPDQWSIQRLKLYRYHR